MTATVTKVATTGMLVGPGILHPDDVLSVDVLVPCCGPRSCCTTYTPGNQNGCSVGPADFALGRAGDVLIWCLLHCPPPTVSGLTI